MPTPNCIMDKIQIQIKALVVCRGISSMKEACLGLEKVEKYCSIVKSMGFKSLKQKVVRRNMKEHAVGESKGKGNVYGYICDFTRYNNLQNIFNKVVLINS